MKQWASVNPPAGALKRLKGFERYNELYQKYTSTCRVSFMG
jgi:hypothetical protein